MKVSYLCIIQLECRQLNIYSYSFIDLYGGSRVRRSNNKGSTFVLVIIITAILMILGITLLTMSSMNMNMKRVDSNSKKTFYFTESGMDQIEARITKQVLDSMNIAKTTVLGREIIIDPTDTEDMLKTKVINEI